MAARRRPGDSGSLVARCDPLIHLPLSKALIRPLTELDPLDRFLQERGRPRIAAAGGWAADH